MSNLKKNIEGLDIPPDILDIIENAKTDGTIGAVKNVIQHESMSLIERANCTFKELFRTLDNEQRRLSDLEEKRKKLLEEMQLLKAEIEKEKESCFSDLEAANSNIEELKFFDLVASGGAEDEELNVYFQRSTEADNSSTKGVGGVGSNERKSMANVAEDIKKGLQDIAERQDQPDAPTTSGLS